MTHFVIRRIGHMAGIWRSSRFHPICDVDGTPPQIIVVRLWVRDTACYHVGIVNGFYLFEAMFFPQFDQTW